ncbi:MAG: DUF4886 domain-containing protein [Dysgonamonadaceae bacterium]|jgi:hypothetical protein|nr:DUF4886 domain-containing protein [Dysgonamonadaceae bacterium]
MKRLFISTAMFIVCALFSVNAQTVVKVLAIGNSFSEDAVEQYLYELGAAGNVTFVIGNMYIGGCSLETHWNNAQNNSAAYSYRKIVGGQKNTTGSVSLETAITDEAWDVITFQQVSQNSGMYATYFPYLTNLKSYASSLATNPNVQFGLQMTWAYAQNSTQSGFVKYHNSQTEMYDTIVSAAPNGAAPAGIDLIIPSGTAIQNGRTTLIGDNFTRDGYHLEYTYGRYTVACTWYEKLTGNSVVGNSYAPNSVSAKQKDIAQHAAHYAVQTPRAVTDMSADYGLLDGSTYVLQNPINIDFGTSGKTTPLPWNNFTAVANGSTLAQMVDMSNAETPVSLEITGEFGNINQNGASQEVTIDGWTIPANANYDSFWANAGAAFEGKQLPSPSLKILNLNPAQSYDFRIFASRKTAENRTTIVTATGLNSQTDSVNAGGASSTGNITAIAKCLNITPKADGTVNLNFRAGVQTQGNEKFFYLGALQIVPAQSAGTNNYPLQTNFGLQISDGYLLVKNSEGNENVMIFDVSGRQVLNGKLSDGTLNISLLLPGIFFLKIKNETMRFLKQ